MTDAKFWSRRIQRGRSWGRVLPVICCMLLAAGCNQADVGEEDPPDAALPNWIVNLDPEPGQETSALRRVEVNHKVLTGGEGLRLEIDGTDVTSYATFGREDNVGGPARLVYDAEAARNFVPLDPGEHTATLKKVRLDDLGEQHEVIDTFEWSFTIQ